MGEDIETSSSSSSVHRVMKNYYDVGGASKSSHEYLMKKKEERSRRKRQKKIDKKTKLRMKKFKAPTIGTMLNYEEHAQKKLAKERNNDYVKDKSGKVSSVWDQSLQDVPKLFRKHQVKIKQFSG